jgi:hypothetical protein
MTKHAAYTASTTIKKFLAAEGLAFSLAGFGLFAGVGTAVADGTEACTGGIPAPKDTAAPAFDAEGSAGTNGAWGTMPDPEEASCEHSHLTSSAPAVSYPAASSYPGNSFQTGWGPMH